MLAPEFASLQVEPSAPVNVEAEDDGDANVPDGKRGDCQDDETIDPVRAGLPAAHGELCPGQRQDDPKDGLREDVQQQTDRVTEQERRQREQDAEYDGSPAGRRAEADVSSAHSAWS